MGERRSNIECEINTCKQLLSLTDYMAIKHSEGELTEEEYSETKEKRKNWRARINELEAELESFKEEG